MLGYDDMGLSLTDIPTGGLPAEYVSRETRRSLADVKGQCKIYPGIDVDVPTSKGKKRPRPRMLPQPQRPRSRPARRA